MGEDALDHRWLDDGGDDLERAAAVRAVFEVEREDTLEQPGPTEARGPSMRAPRRGRGAR